MTPKIPGLTRAGWLLLCLLLTACTTNTQAPLKAPGRTTGKTPPSYVVHSGDSLYSIAWRFGLDHRRLASINGLSPNSVIYPGQRLYLKSSGTRRPSHSVVKKPATSAAAKLATRKPVLSNKPVGKWRWPSSGNALRKKTGGNASLEIRGNKGQSVKAAASGTVVYTGSGLRGYGKLIIVNHNKRYLSAYGHNEKMLVKEGDKVKAGQKIATMGTHDSRAQLHFEIRKDGNPVDPLRLLPRR